MHELSIAQSIYNHVIQEVEQKQLPPVRKIVVRVGELSGVMPDALQFCFEAIIKETPLDKCQFIIEHVKLNGQCNNCRQKLNIENYVFNCPHCQSTDITVIQGEELDIAYIEVEET